MTTRFTLDGSPALEAHLAATSAKVGERIRAMIPEGELEGILLGGGYGRGEGGVLRTPEGDKPYNDLEYYVFVKGSGWMADRRWREPLHHLGEELSPEAGLEVEFKALTLGKLRNASPQMFYYDLVVGHRWVVGDDRLLAGCEHHRDASRIPLHEATRLLMNRCSGLLYSAERLARASFGGEESDFVGRNHAKARLAFGDAWLAAQGQYHWSCKERHERIRRLAAVGPTDPGKGLSTADLMREHAAGIQFKLFPVRTTASREALQAEQDRLVQLGLKLWLWLEGRRLGMTFGTPRSYALDGANLCPETSALKNALVNLRTFRGGALGGGRLGRYPRERLLRSLALLLWEPETLRDPALLAAVQGALRSDAQDFPGLVQAYLRLWQRFN